MAGALLIGAGLFVILQVTRGRALERLGVLGS
jgi:hypothetical protein